MIDLVLNNGDFVISNYGDISTHLSSDDNIIQMINSAINTIKGENIFHSEYGNDAWNQRLKMVQSGYDIIKSCTKEAILPAVQDISEIISIDVVRGNENGECIISYVVLMSDGRTISSNTSINIL